MTLRNDFSYCMNEFRKNTTPGEKALLAIGGTAYVAALAYVFSRPDLPAAPFIYTLF